MKNNVSLAIETSSRGGGVALGADGLLKDAIQFDASARHATQLLCHIDELFKRAGAARRDLKELYVSTGPGSFTGLRIGITVARTLGQLIEGLQIVAVPTAEAVAAFRSPLHGLARGPGSRRP